MFDHTYIGSNSPNNKSESRRSRSRRRSTKDDRQDMNTQEKPAEYLVSIHRDERTSIVKLTQD